jgi:hypothetical protein
VFKGSEISLSQFQIYKNVRKNGGASNFHGPSKKTLGAKLYILDAVF